MGRSFAAKHDAWLNSGNPYDQPEPPEHECEGPEIIPCPNCLDEPGAIAQPFLPGPWAPFECTLCQGFGELRTHKECGELVFEGHECDTCGTYCKEGDDGPDEDEG